MDNGENSHMTGNVGNFIYYFNMSNNIITGNGHHIPIIGYNTKHTFNLGSEVN